MKHVSPYLSAEALGIGEKERELLIGVAKDLADGDYDQEEFNMEHWGCCIWGHMLNRAHDSGMRYSEWSDLDKRGLWALTCDGQTACPSERTYSSITSAEASEACYNFLTVGRPKWKKVLS